MKLKEHESIVYVGLQSYIPSDIRGKHCPFSLLHPKEFKEYLEGNRFLIPLRFWTNNAYVVDLFDPLRIICCHEKKQLPLSYHPEFDKWKDEFPNGEFWSLVGEEWVND